MKRKYGKNRWRVLEDDRFDREDRDDRTFYGREHRRKAHTIRERRRAAGWWTPDQLQPDDPDDDVR